MAPSAQAEDALPSPALSSTRRHSGPVSTFPSHRDGSSAVKSASPRRNQHPAGEQQATLRRQMRQRRRAMSEKERAQAADRAAAQLLRSPQLQRSRRIALYFAANGELDPAPLLRAALARRKRCYVPTLPSGRGRRMWFAAITRDSTLRRNRFGIPEPTHGRRERLPARRLDLVVVPLVAFDDQGHRIGMGGGYYDRTFAFRRVRHRWRRPRLVGYAYEFQRVPAIPAQPWDVNLDAIATERGVFPARRKG